MFGCYADCLLQRQRDAGSLGILLHRQYSLRTGIREESSTRGRESPELRGKRMVPDAIERLAPPSATFLEPARRA